MAFPARYSSYCPLCGQTIPKGAMIEKRNGQWAHQKCPVPVAAEPAKLEVIKPLFPPLPNVPPETVIKVYWSDGEYLSAFCPNSLTKELEEAGIARYVSGWGTKMENEFLMFAAGMPVGPISREFYEKIGQGESNFTFTWAQVIAYVMPRREAAEKRAAEKRVKSAESEAAKFAEAKATGKAVAIKTWSEECDGSTEECDIDNVTIYAMPDGTKKTTRSHSW